MHQEEFEQEVRVRARTQGVQERVFVDRALERRRPGNAANKPQWGRQDVRDCALEAQYYSDNLPRQHPTGGGIGFEFDRLKAGDLMVSDLLLESIADEVKTTRIDLFASEKIPFPSYPDAVSWIQSEEYKRRAPTPAESQGLADEIRCLRERANQVLGSATRLKARTLTFSVWGAERNATADSRVLGTAPHIVAVVLGTGLVPLFSFLESAKAQTGFPTEALVAHILSGFRPVRPPISVSWTEETSSPAPTSWTITIHKPDVSEADFKRIYAYFRDKRGGDKANPIDSTDLAVLQTMKRMGGPPPKRQGRGAFWEQVSHSLSQQGITLGPDAARQRFNRLRSKKRLGLRTLAI